jgi:hypothetical protein
VLEWLYLQGNRLTAGTYTRPLYSST